MVVQMSDAPERLPGCSDLCLFTPVIRPHVMRRELLLLHDPESHERYGRELASDLGAVELLRTGLLTLDRRRLEVNVAGREVSLTATETKILFCLADQIGHLVPYKTLVRDVWGYAAAAGDRCDSLITTSLNRLRWKLGHSEAAGLIETHIGVGLKLRAYPVGEARPFASMVNSAQSGGWSSVRPSCSECGTTQRQHRGYGVCSARACREAYKRRQAVEGNS